MEIDGSVALVSDFGLGGANAGGGMFRGFGAAAVLITGAMPETVLASWREQYDDVVVLDALYEPEEIARAAESAAARTGRPLVGLFSCFDGLSVPAATAAASLGLPHPPIEALRRCRVKYATRQASQAAGLPTPRFALLSSPDQAGEVADDVGLPAVVKPVNGTAGHMVRIVDSVEAMQAAYGELATHVGDQFGGMYRQPLLLDPGTGTTVHPGTTFLVEEQMQGREYAAEVVIRDGVVECAALLDKCIVDPETRYEMGFTWPPFVGDGEQAEIWRLIEQTVQAVGLDDTIGHVEVMLTPDGPRLLEVNPGRAGGGHIPLMPPRITGIDTPTELVAMQCGLPRPRRESPEPPERLTNLTVYPERNGTLVAIHGLDALAALPGVSHVVPGVKPGEVIDLSREVHGVNFLVEGVPLLEDLLALFDDARSMVTFEYA